MKKLLLILLCLPMIGFGQSDMIILSSGDTIIGKVIEVGVNDITYQHKDETTNNVTKKRELAKVIYSSGRIQSFKGLKILHRKIKNKEEKQEEKIGFQKNLEIGFVIGRSSSNIYGKYKDVFGNNLNSIVRTNGGLILQYNISDLLSVNSKLLYQVKGYNFSGAFEITTVDNPEVGIGTGYLDDSFVCHYISLPILLKLNFGNKLRGNINTGFYTSYLLEVVKDSEGPSYDFDSSSKGNEQRYNSFSLDSQSKIDFGYVIGGGISYVIDKKLRLSFDSNLEYGIIKKDTNEETSFSQHNIAYNFLVGCSYIL
jgi:hypothetical protein